MASRPTTTEAPSPEEEEKLRLEKEFAEIQKEYKDALALNMQIEQENSVKEEQVRVKELYLSQIRAKNKSELQQLDLEELAVRERLQYELLVEESSLSSMELRFERLTDLQRENDELRDSVQQMHEKIFELSMNHANAIHNINREVKAARVQMESTLRSELANLDLMYRKKAFFQLHEKKKKAMLRNSQLKDEISMQGVGINNLTTRLRNQEKGYLLCMKDIQKLNKRARRLRDRLGLLTSTKVSQTKMLSEVLLVEKEVSSRIDELKQQIETPTLSDLETGILELLRQSHESKLKIELWNKRLAQLQSLYLDIKPVDEKERSGAFSSNIFKVKAGRNQSQVSYAAKTINNNNNNSNNNNSSNINNSNSNNSGNNNNGNSGEGVGSPPPSRLSIMSRKSRLSINIDNVRSNKSNSMISLNSINRNNIGNSSSNSNNINSNSRGNSRSGSPVKAEMNNNSNNNNSNSNSNSNNTNSNTGRASAGSSEKKQSHNNNDNKTSWGSNSSNSSSRFDWESEDNDSELLDEEEEEARRRKEEEEKQMRVEIENVSEEVEIPLRLAPVDEDSSIPPSRTNSTTEGGKLTLSEMLALIKADPDLSKVFEDVRGKEGNLVSDGMQKTSNQNMVAWLALEILDIWDSSYEEIFSEKKEIENGANSPDNAKPQERPISTRNHLNDNVDHEFHMILAKLQRNIPKDPIKFEKEIPDFMSELNKLIQKLIDFEIKSNADNTATNNETTETKPAEVPSHSKAGLQAIEEGSESNAGERDDFDTDDDGSILDDNSSESSSRVRAASYDSVGNTDYMFLNHFKNVLEVQTPSHRTMNEADFMNASEDADENLLLARLKHDEHELDHLGHPHGATADAQVKKSDSLPMLWYRKPKPPQKFPTIDTHKLFHKDVFDDDALKNADVKQLDNDIQDIRRLLNASNEVIGPPVALASSIKRNGNHGMETKSRPNSSHVGESLLMNTGMLSTTKSVDTSSSTASSFSITLPRKANKDPLSQSAALVKSSSNLNILCRAQSDAALSKRKPDNRLLAKLKKDSLKLLGDDLFNKTSPMN